MKGGFPVIMGTKAPCRDDVPLLHQIFWFLGIGQGFMLLR